MKKIKYYQIGTAAKVLGEYANQCRDEHEAEINLAMEHYDLDKEMFYTEEQKRAVAEFTLGREIKAKAKRLNEVLARERMSDNEMRKSLNSKKREKEANTENARKPRKKGKPSKVELEGFKSNWEFKEAKTRGWIKEASRHYGFDRKTISEIYNKKEK